MTPGQFDRIATKTAELYIQYGSLLQGILKSAYQTMARSAARNALIETQDHSFQLGLLAGLRLNGDPEMKAYLELLLTPRLRVGTTNPLEGEPS